MIPVGARHNPFCSERIRPGALPFLFPASDGMASLIQRLRGAGMRGQIVGRNGSGKSTLLFSAACRLGEEGLQVEYLRASSLARLLGVPRADIVVVDELDSLPRASRVLAVAWLRRRHGGLLAATHASLGLPTIYQAVPGPGTLRAVVDALGEPVPDGVLQSAFAASGGNLRLALFRLYDYWEERSDAPASARTCGMASLRRDRK